MPATIPPAARAELTSTGKLRDMRKVGTLEFTLNGQLLSLGAYTETDLRTLFVPFRDLTSDGETYGSGRYLDLKRTGTGFYELDFNLAYNPYCYYNKDFDCPYPPRESRLQIPIRAGRSTISPGATSLRNGTIRIRPGTI